MPKQLTLKGNLDDAMLSLRIVDFSGGLNSESDPQDLPLNASPDCQNVKLLKPGRLIGRNGYIVTIGSLAAKGDGVAFFYDANGNRRLALWSNGNIYDITTGTLSSIATGIYAAGNRIAWTILNGVLYYSDGVTITGSGASASGTRKWDPVAATEGAVISSGSTGTIPTPAAKVMTTYAGSIVWANTTYSGTTYTDGLIFCNVNDPTTVLGTQLTRVGQGQGGAINSCLPFAVSAAGVSPFRALFVGKSQQGIYALQGALGQTTEILVNCPTGVRDGATAKFVYIPNVGGCIVFLGTDNKVWYTNGVVSGELSSAIRTEISDYIKNQLGLSLTQAFTAVLNYSDFQYVLDLGGSRQYVYDWDKQIWTRYIGWPSGYWTEARDPSGNPTMYVASSTNVSQCNIGSTDNGGAIAPYWKTGWLNIGDPELLKIWKWIYVSYYTDTGALNINATTNQGMGSTASGTMTPTTYAPTGNVLWDQAQWDVDKWAASGSAAYNPYKSRMRLVVPTTGLDGSPESLRGYDVQVKISEDPSQPTGHFELLGFNLLYLPRGRKRVAS